jgi:hypothetical protein
MALKFIKPERLSLKVHPELDEKWVQDRSAEDPSILGLGDLILKDKERIQPKGGRLDLLLQDPESGRRYEVEVQLGHTDESHIFWLKDESLEDSENLPEPSVIAEEIVENLQAALESFRAISEELGEA